MVCKDCHGHLVLLDMTQETTQYVCLRCGQQQKQQYLILKAIPCQE